MLTMTETVLNHDIANASLKDINDFVLSQESQLKELDIATVLWIIIDQDGLESDTCILVQRKYDAESGEMSNECEAVRIPYVEAWCMFGNLNIANMDFVDFLYEDAGLQEDGTYKWCGPFPTQNEALIQSSKEAATKREKFLKLAKDLGHVE
jgi:hypothetical protein